MWILLMIIFSQPCQVSEIQILGTYIQKPACEKEIKSALSVDVPTKSSFGCIKIEKFNATTEKRKKV